MRKAFLRCALLLLAAVYGLAAKHVAATATHAEFQGAYQAAQGSSIADPSGLFLFHTSPTESLVNSFTNLPAPGFKTTASGFAASVRAKGRTARSTLVQYLRASRDLLLALRRSAITFPFHCFW